MPSKWGGKRAGAGRPRSNPPTTSCSIRLTDAQRRLLRMWGKGDMSAGLRWLIDEAAKRIRRVE